jgi:hypothetical protein
LPATDNNNDDETTQQLTSENGRNVTRSVKSKDGNNNFASQVVVSDNNNTVPHDCGKSEENYDGNTTTTAINGSARRLTRQCRSINDEDDGSAKASRPKKK